MRIVIEPDELLSFEVNGKRYGLLIGATHYIVMYNDFVLQYIPVDEPFIIETQEYHVEIVRLGQLILMSKPMKFSEFCPLWGTEDRVRRNYTLVVETAWAIGLDSSMMPEWGRK